MTFRWISLLMYIGAAMAQAPKVGGDYWGMLGPLHLKLHLKMAASGVAEGTMDSVDQGANGLPCANFHLDGKAFSFDVPSVAGKWHGTASADGATLEGSWSQGQEMPLVFRRDVPFVPAEKPSLVDGVWLGMLDAGGTKLRIQVRVKSDRAGKEYCSFDSLDQGAAGMPCDNVQLNGDRFSFEITPAGGRWLGSLSKSGNELDGTWSQGQDTPLRLTRQAAAIVGKAIEPPRFDEALAPVPAGDLKAVIDRDLAVALKEGALAPATSGGLVIGVEQRGTRRILTYGPVKEDSIFEIGSISKTFTALMLSKMVQQNRVKLDDPVREFLPPGTVAKPEGLEITLFDLAIQHSGLPRMPDNFSPADLQDPYADYRPANLYAYLAKHGVAKPPDAQFNYSNLGLGLLGQALANRAGMSYPELLKALVTGPLGLNDTVVKLSPEHEKRFAQGHGPTHQPAKPWTLDALAGAGSIRSTASDMLTYLEAQLHPDKAKGDLASAIEMCHKLHGDSLPGMKIGLAWLYQTGTGSFWHNGGTGGFSSYALFNAKEDFVVVVLYNTTLGANGSFADSLGEHVAARLSGRPAMSLKE